MASTTYLSYIATCQYAESCDIVFGSLLTFRTLPQAPGPTIWGYLTSGSMKVDPVGDPNPQRPQPDLHSLAPARIAAQRGECRILRAR